MPSTPRFSLSQTLTHLTLTLTLPYIRVSSAETHVDGCNFSFSCKPYLLKLTFPGELVDDEENQAVAVYDPNVGGGTMTVTLLKAVEGMFEDLDLTTKLLQPRLSAPTKKREGPPVIEVVGEEGGSGEAEETKPEVSEGLVYDEEAPDEETPVSSSLFNISSSSSSSSSSSLPPPPPPSVTLSTAPTYGFARSFSGCFDSLREELKEMCEFGGMDSVRSEEKRVGREKVEREKYDEERYCGDFFANDDRFSTANDGGKDPLYLAAVAHDPFADLAAALGSLSLTGSQQETLSSLPNKEHLLTPSSTRAALLSIVDVLFGYCYDSRMTEGEGSVESPWTIAILSPTLSWFETWDLPGDTAAAPMLAAVRRSLIYPYLRFLEFSVKTVAADVVRLVLGGRREVLRAFLTMKGMFDRSDTHYLLSRFYLDDYCVFLQKIGDEEFGAFGEEVEREWRGVVGEGGGVEKVRERLEMELEEAEDAVLGSVPHAA